MLTRTYTLPITGSWTAIATDSSGTYESSATSNVISDTPRKSLNFAETGGWEELAVGDHVVQVVAIAHKYKRSEFSDSVTVRKTDEVFTTADSEQFHTVDNNTFCVQAE